MSQSSHFVVPSLLCAEDEEFEDVWFVENHWSSQRNLSESLTVHSEGNLVLMIRKESEQLPNSDYLMRLRIGDLDIQERAEALDWIFKAHAHFNFGPLCAYLAVNYFDRFLSSIDLPEGQIWTMQLLAVACLSLAAKMEEIEVPLSLDLQVEDAKFVFEAKTIQKMELIVLSRLNWRMQSITPFSFVDCFFERINGDHDASRALIAKSLRLILSTLRGIYFLEFRPSEIAAAAVISIATENTEKAISALAPYVQKDRVINCLNIIEELDLLSGCVDVTRNSVPPAPQSPIAVLDAECFSYIIDDLGISKRRRLNGPREMDRYS